MTKSHPSVGSTFPRTRRAESLNDELTSSSATVVLSSSSRSWNVKFIQKLIYRIRISVAAKKVAKKNIELLHKRTWTLRHPDRILPFPKNPPPVWNKMLLFPKHSSRHDSARRLTKRSCWCLIFVWARKPNTNQDMNKMFLKLIETSQLKQK